MLEEARKYLDNIISILKNENRYFLDEDFVKRIEKIFAEHEITIQPNSCFFRARKFERKDIDISKQGSTFEGYDAPNSFVNLHTKWPTAGRMNPQGIFALYMASDVRTAITELHPYYSAIYSVASIMNTKELRIVDLSSSSSAIKDDFTRELSILIQEELSKGENMEDYVFPQYIAAFCQSRGYDGISFRSKYATKADQKNKTGINYTVFNYDKCKVTGSKLKSISNVTVKVDNIVFGEDERITKYSDYKSVFEAYINLISDVTGTDYNQIILCAKKHRVEPCLYVVASKISKGKNAYPEASFEGIIGEAIAKRKMVYLGDISESENYIAAEASTKSEIVIPIVYDGVILGALNSESETIGHYSIEMIDKLNKMAKELSYILKNLNYSADYEIAELSRYRVIFVDNDI